MKRTALIAVSLFVVLDHPSLAKEKEVTWEDTDCLRTFRFDPSKYREASVWNTMHLLVGGHIAVYPPFVDFGFRPQDFQKYDFSQFKFDFDHLNQQCAAALGLAQNTTFVPLAGIENYRRALIDTINDTCEPLAKLS